MTRTFTRLIAAMALVIPALALGAQPAGAATFQNCAKVAGTATFTPGLTNTPRDNTVRVANGTQTSCTPLAATGGSGKLTATITVKQGSCAKLGTGNQTLTGKATSSWKNGKLSHYNITMKTGSGANATTATITGLVHDGLFAGKHMKVTVKFKVGAGANCTTKPIKSVTFTNTKPFVIYTP
jgi:hypothetical protein